MCGTTNPSTVHALFNDSESIIKVSPYSSELLNKTVYLSYNSVVLVTIITEGSIEYT